MHSVNGRNTYSGTSWAAAFQTITHALNQAGVASGDTIEIAGGPYRYDPSAAYTNPEAFPIRANGTLTGITLKGRGRPVINGYYEIAALTYSNAPFGGGFANSIHAPCLLVQHGWTVKGLTFENLHYDKTDVPTVASTPNNARVIGIHVLDLSNASGTGTALIEDCVFDDNYVGVYVRDTTSSLQSQTRVVDIADCAFRKHGPVGVGNGVPVEDRGHQGILTNNYRSMTINLTDCTFEEDHDGMESANDPVLGLDDAVVNATGCYFKNVENGFEMSDGIIEITSCTFEKCEAKDPDLGGVGSTAGQSFSVGLGLRGTANNPAGSTVKLRENFFDRCQVGVWASAPFDVIDLGTGPSGTARGNNTFTMDTKSPWNTGGTYRVYNISHVGIFSTSQRQVDAIGNTFTYDAGYGLTYGFNQGCDTNGQYDLLVAPYPSGMASPFVFQDDVGVNIQTNTSNPCGNPNPCSWGDKPQFRHTVLTVGTGVNANRPWNIATGQRPIQTCTGNPCAGMVAPSIRVK